MSDPTLSRVVQEYVEGVITAESAVSQVDGLSVDSHVKHSVIYLIRYAENLNGLLERTVETHERKAKQ